MNTDFIPNLTHASGQVLTIADWTAAGVHIATCDLSALLVKPGIKCLNDLNNLKQYWDWPGQLLLNRSDLTPNKTGMIQIRSAFDGRILKFTEEEISALIQHLKPDYLAPDDFKENNAPSEDALKGVIYTSKNTENNTFSIQDKKNTLDFSVLDENCACPGCKAKLTRAYFHHLYAHTPLLCHRWLIIHNQWMTHCFRG
jgi:queuine/archaeosine tRNA-ribosyltransferase